MTTTTSSPETAQKFGEINAEGRVINGRWKVGGKIGEGSFGYIFCGTDLVRNESVAIKMEKLFVKSSQLQKESKIFKQLDGSLGFPRLKYFGVEEGYNTMISELLGPSIESMFNYCERKLSLKTVLMLAHQMLCRIEYVHNKNIIHQDIKPENFLMGLGEKESVLHLIDFGLSKSYRDSATLSHMPYQDNKSLIGTARYASISNHMGIEQSRRDDLESIGYVLVYLAKGCLPWQGLKAGNKREKYEHIAKKKLNTSVESLTKGLPSPFSIYLNYVKSLRFEDEPNYAYLRKLFKEYFIKQGFLLDDIYDWTAKTRKFQDTEATISNLKGDEAEKKPTPNAQNQQTQNLLTNKHERQRTGTEPGAPIVQHQTNIKDASENFFTQSMSNLSVEMNTSANDVRVYVSPTSLSQSPSQSPNQSRSVSPSPDTSRPRSARGNHTGFLQKMHFASGSTGELLDGNDKSHYGTKTSKNFLGNLLSSRRRSSTSTVSRRKKEKNGGERLKEEKKIRKMSTGQTDERGLPPPAHLPYYSTESQEKKFEREVTDANEEKLTSIKSAPTLSPFNSTKKNEEEEKEKEKEKEKKEKEKEKENLNYLDDEKEVTEKGDGSLSRRQQRKSTGFLPQIFDRFLPKGKPKRETKAKTTEDHESTEGSLFSSSSDIDDQENEIGRLHEEEEN